MHAIVQDTSLAHRGCRNRSRHNDKVSHVKKLADGDLAIEKSTQIRQMHEKPIGMVPAKKGS